MFWKTVLLCSDLHIFQTGVQYAHCGGLVMNDEWKHIPTKDDETEAREFYFI